MVYIKEDYEAGEDKSGAGLERILERLGTQIRELKEEVEKLKEVVKTHTHNPEEDNITPITRTIDLDAREAFKVAKSGGVSGEELTAGPFTIQRAAIFAGTEAATLEDGNDVSTMLLEHQGQTTGSSNQTFFFGYRPPSYGGNDARVVSTTKIKVNQTLIPNSLVGVQLMMGAPSTGTYSEFFTISSNTENTITFSGTSALTGIVNWFTYTPVYLGSANFPWRRIYIAEDIRFGYGTSSGSGVIYIKFGNGSPEGVVTANVGSLYLRRDGGSGTTLYVKQSGTGNTGWAGK